jgi:hypothetical protein
MGEAGVIQLTILRGIYRHGKLIHPTLALKQLIFLFRRRQDLFEESSVRQGGKEALSSFLSAYAADATLLF